ncbi:snodprot1 [Coprinopsis cinerea okayama7|uniref:Snodprot1 n=1 Tax=Coprinopsis cinerea (strain Okayama-7 / 130 / ATCC MYA-4618 / FGSC 9003) TaxID=240176 RepID=A8P9R5_COPC7|nr:snodprot1 [Coprinopsis cinerea okayama7\|eukprot:XP_001839820.1 snodprot1 [Coprinopsis cinerea okayama7\
MQSLSLISIIGLPLLTLAQTTTPPPPTSVETTASYDAAYGNADQSLASVSCSNGDNGLLTRGFTTFGSLPSFPNIGGSFAVTGWNSPACGSCWQLAYTHNGTTTTVNVTAVDVALGSFNLAPEALDTLTGGRAVELGRVDVVATQIPASSCGL